MNSLADKFFEGIKGKKVGFIGIGTSNLPLIKLFSDKGAVVTAYDKKDFESLGENAVKAKEGGVKNDSEKETIAFHGAWRLFVCTYCGVDRGEGNIRQ